MLEVFRTAEFRRVAALPRRPQYWSEADLALAIEGLSAELRTPGGEQTLRPIQARAFCEALDVGALVGEIYAGGGKFLISAGLFTLWGSVRGLLIVPAKLREQTYIEWAKAAKHWRLGRLTGVPASLGLGSVVGDGPGEVRVISYESLSTATQAGFLEEYRPDTIVCDEAHALARLGTARSRRLFRYVRVASPRFVPLSASMQRKSIRESAHLIVAALGGDRAPVPDHYPDLEQWSCALDEVRDEMRIDGGALWDFVEGGRPRGADLEERLEALRRGYRQRYIETPGIVSTSETFEGARLRLIRRPIVVPAGVAAALQVLRDDAVLPSGDGVDSALAVWQHARELACGFAYRWDPPAPPEWLAARKAWFTYVRGVLARNVPGLDSPLQVWNAVSSGRLDDGQVPQREAWIAVRDTFKPNPVPLWLSRYAFEDAEAWALETGGVVWVTHSSAVYRDGTAVEGGASDDVLGAVFKKIPYFGAGKSGEGIRSHRGPCAASLRAHGTGKNLVQWDDALILSVPSSGATMEQLLARLHRDGQKKDEVRYHFYCRTQEDDDALKTCLRDARYVEAIRGQPQRILAAQFEGWAESGPLAWVDEGRRG